ncbi:MAG: penicillin-binding protein 1C [Acidobacteria bacterium]|nr:MAG: penicillin-binding protein 1C [Acidobacteriota bacterium]
MTRRRLRIALVGIAALAATTAWVRLGPLPPHLIEQAAASSTTIVDRRGETLYESRSAFGTRGAALAADALPATLVSATLAAEDARFFRHTGVDPFAIARAAWKNLRAFRRVEGGSTITQQVVKMLVHRQWAISNGQWAIGNGQSAMAGRGWATKIREAVLAERLEHRLSKREILALYLNLAPYGNQIDGAERASFEYFGRPASTLTPAEAAFLAALPQQPTRYNPRNDPTRARNRQLAILRIEAERGWLSAADLSTARAERLSLAESAATGLAPHFIQRILATSPSGARRIETTLDAALQRTVEGIISAHRPSLDEHHAANVAVVVLDNRRHEWLAWEGSGNYGDRRTSGSIDGVTAPRQPGSALKPFTYAAALERGVLPSRVLADVPSQFPTAKAGILYRPRNYDGRYRGPMLLRHALAGSENVPAVALAADVGVPAIAQLLRRAGVTTLTRDAAFYGLGLTLGDAEVRLDELTAAYAAFANGGQFAAPRAVTKIDDRTTADADASLLVSRRTAFWISSILSDADARAFIFGRGGSLDFPFTVAVKTGTSTSYRDNWTIGYTKDVTVGVWVGNFDRTSLHNSSGVTGAGPIFHDVMMAAVERARGSASIDDMTPIVAPTPDVEQVEVCARSGLRPGDACPSRATEWLPVGAALPDCDWHFTSDEGPVTIWPEPYREWATNAGYLTKATHGPSVESVAAAAKPATRRSSLTITSPLAGATFLIDPTLRPEFQALPLRAIGAEGRTEWSVDGTPVATDRWPLSRGVHRISVTDARGRVATVSVTVR